MKIAKAELPDDLHARFAARCKAQGRTMADRIREMVALDAGTAPVVIGPARRSRQVNVLLTDDLLDGLEAHAAPHGMRCTQVLFAMSRALVERAPSPSLAEVDALYDSNRALHALRRDLGVLPVVEPAEVGRLRREFEAHAKRVSSVLDGALNRWRVDPWA